MNADERLEDAENVLRGVDALHTAVGRYRERLHAAQLASFRREALPMSPQLLGSYLELGNGLLPLLRICHASRIGADLRFGSAKTLFLCLQLIALRGLLAELRHVTHATWPISYGRFGDGDAVVDYMETEVERAVAQWRGAVARWTGARTGAHFTVDVYPNLAARATLQALSTDVDVVSFLRQLSRDENEPGVVDGVQRALHLAPWPDVTSTLRHPFVAGFQPTAR